MMGMGVSKESDSICKDTEIRMYTHRYIILLNTGYEMKLGKLTGLHSAESFVQSA